MKTFHTFMYCILISEFGITALQSALCVVMEHLLKLASYLTFAHIYTAVGLLTVA